MLVADLELSRFSIAKDDDFIIPVLLQSLEASRASSAAPGDQLQYFASPWSAPAWMKKPEKLEGGLLQKEFMEVYARYLAKFIDAYAARGIPIIAITPQNEPMSSQTYPSTFFPPEEEAQLIKNYLGPLMQERSCEIWCFDHNFNTPFYPEHVLSDADAAKYVSGSAWHAYRGQPTSMTEIHDKFPDKGIFFTETSMFGVLGAQRIINIFRNWAETYNAWVVMLDSNMQPNAGPFNPDPTMVVLDVSSLKISYNMEYYMYGQFSKFIRRGAVRVSSETLLSPDTTEDEDDASVTHVSFVNVAAVSGQSTLVCVVANKSPLPKTVQLSWNSLVATVVLAPMSVNTFTWSS